MTTIIVTNEFVQLNEILSLIGSYVKEAPQFSSFKKAILVFNSSYNKTKDLSSSKCRKVEKDT